MRRMLTGIGLAALAFTGAAADAQTPTRIRGTIAAVDGATISIKSRDGRDLTLKLAADLGVSVTTAARFEDLKEGDFVGATTKRAPNGDEVAVEIHFLPPTARMGQSAWDLEPNSKMTNANVRSKVLGTGNHEITLRFSDGEQKVVVPSGTPIVRAVPGARSDLVPGEYVFVSAQVGPDGALTAQRIQVGKDGVRPPQ